MKGLLRVAFLMVAGIYRELLKLLTGLAAITDLKDLKDDMVCLPCTEAPPKPPDPTPTRRGRPPPESKNKPTINEQLPPEEL